MFTDSHAHLHPENYNRDVDAVIKRSFDANVNTIINIGAGYGFEGNLVALKISAEYENIYPTIGVHPHDAKIVDDNMLSELEKMMILKEVKAVGESGLDYHYNYSEKADQIRVFKEHIKLANKIKKPLIIHCRNAHDEVLSILEKEYNAEIPGIVHCFSGDVEIANKYLEFGFYISIPGIVTFKKAQDMQQVAKMVPLNKLLVETDCPYLAPVPYRGKKNEPAYVAHTVKKIAEIKGKDTLDIAKITSENAIKVYML